MCSYIHTHTHNMQHNPHICVYWTITLKPVDHRTLLWMVKRAEKKHGSSRCLRPTLLVLSAIESGHKHTYPVQENLPIVNTVIVIHKSGTFNHLCWLWSIWPTCYESPPWNAAVHCGWTRQVPLLPDFRCEGSSDSDLHNVTVLPRPVNHCGSQPVSKQGGHCISNQAGKPSH